MMQDGSEKKIPVPVDNLKENLDDYVEAFFCWSGRPD
jgi:hypothetical protein